jgi:hypothetical protein
MAVNYSSKELIFAKRNAISKFYPLPNNYIYKVIAKILDIYFTIKVKLVNLKKYIFKIFEKNIQFVKLTEDQIVFNLNQKNFTDFRVNNYCFIKNFLDEKSWEIIKDSWPSNNNFFLNKSVMKHYYIHKIIYSDEDVNKLKNENIKIFSRLLLTKNFSNLINQIANDRNNYNLSNIVYSIASYKSYLIPHIDSVSKEMNYHKTLNFIFFVEGNDQCIEYSGGTGIYRDSEFNDPIFIPTTLNNSCLIYDSSENFFHGFKKMGPNGYRKAITFSFMSNK